MPKAPANIVERPKITGTQVNKGLAQEEAADAVCLLISECGD